MNSLVYIYIYTVYIHDIEGKDSTCTCSTSKMSMYFVQVVDQQQWQPDSNNSCFWNSKLDPGLQDISTFHQCRLPRKATHQLAEPPVAQCDGLLFDAATLQTAPRRYGFRRRDGWVQNGTERLLRKVVPSPSLDFLLDFEQIYRMFFFFANQKHEISWNNIKKYLVRSVVRVFRSHVSLLAKAGAKAAWRPRAQGPVALAAGLGDLWYVWSKKNKNRQT